MQTGTKANRIVPIIQITHNGVHCTTVDVDLQNWVTLPPSISLFFFLSLSSPHLPPSPMPQYLISLVFDSSPSGCALLNQTAISERNSTSKPANTLRSRGAHTEGCFIARRAVTHAWLPISLFIIWCEKLIIFFYQMFNQQREDVWEGSSHAHGKLFREAFAVAKTRIYMHMWSLPDPEGDLLRLERATLLGELLFKDPIFP